MAGRAVRQRAPEHLDGMLSEQQGINDTVETTTRREVRGFRSGRQMPGLRSGQINAMSDLCGRRPE
jgi:hypothetical protein